MHPAPSVILFTTLSGIGFGLLFFLGLGLGSVGGVAFVFFGMAYALSVGGLAASTLHLGHPERMLKAFSQWRSSWLSREGCCAVLTLLVMAVLGIGRVFLDVHWTFVGIVGAVLCLVTVITTAMIYTQLKSVPRWHSPLTPLLFVAYAAAGGSLTVGQVDLARILIAATAIVQLLWWRQGDRALDKTGTSLKTATGLGHIGTPRPFETPHTQPNYLTREMVFTVARTHAKLLRLTAVVFAFVIPVFLLSLPLNHMLAAVTVLSHLTGVLITRWLFFAEAEHVVSLYYGAKPIR